MHKEFNLFVKLDAVKSASTKKSVTDGDWVFEGIASTADEDLYGEVVYPESFTNSIDFFKEKGKIYFNHEYAQKNADWLERHGFTKEEILSLKMPIGVPLDAKLVDEGLYIKAILNKEHPLSPHIWKSFFGNKDKRFESTMGLSIGAKYLGTPRREYNLKSGKYVTYLPELLLYEVSVTPEPVNPHTRTWTTALKSMMKNAETPAASAGVSHHTITPDEVIFDPERNQLVVKSTVVGGSGATFVFESYVNVEEDIKNPMKKKISLKAVEEALLEEETIEGTPPEGEEFVDMGGDAGLEAGLEGGDDLPGDDGLLGDEGLTEGEEVISDDEVDGLIDSLIGDDSGDLPEEDDAQSMILDKLDAILDALQTVLNPIEPEVSDLPGEDQVDTTPPVLKSTEVELSEESAQRFGAAIKSVLEGFEDRIVANLVGKLTNETTVVKSALSSSKKPARIVNPPVMVDASTPAEPDIVQKSVVKYSGDSNKTLSEENQVVLKSLVEEYVAIVGHSAAHSQKRGRVIKSVEEKVGISQKEFYRHVREYDAANRKAR